jgi:hypothetical protein
MTLKADISYESSSVATADAPAIGFVTTVTPISFDFDANPVPGVLLGLLLVGSWACPVLVGIWTQVRKGLPGFARAPATVLAACNYESHRLIYGAIVCAILLALDLLIRISQGPSLFAGFSMKLASYSACSILSAAAMVTLYGALGWLGALRSDFTKQIVRSRLHAARIVWMYGILLSIVFAMIGAALVLALIQ